MGLSDRFRRAKADPPAGPPGEWIMTVVSDALDPGTSYLPPSRQAEFPRRLNEILDRTDTAELRAAAPVLLRELPRFGDEGFLGNPALVSLAELARRPLGWSADEVRHMLQLAEGLRPKAWHSGSSNWVNDLYRLPLAAALSLDDAEFAALAPDLEPLFRVDLPLRVRKDTDGIVTQLLERLPDPFGSDRTNALLAEPGAARRLRFDLTEAVTTGDVADVDSTVAVLLALPSAQQPSAAWRRQLTALLAETAAAGDVAAVLLRSLRDYTAERAKESQYPLGLDDVALPDDLVTVVRGACWTVATARRADAVDLLTAVYGGKSGQTVAATGALAMTALPAEVAAPALATLRRGTKHKGLLKVVDKAVAALATDTGVTPTN